MRVNGQNGLSEAHIYLPVPAGTPQPSLGFPRRAIDPVPIATRPPAPKRPKGRWFVGFLLLDNGIAATAFLATSGVPVVVELGGSLDLLLLVLVLQVLAARMRVTFGRTDMDELSELRD